MLACFGLKPKHKSGLKRKSESVRCNGYYRNSEDLNGHFVRSASIGHGGGKGTPLPNRKSLRIKKRDLDYPVKIVQQRPVQNRTNNNNNYNNLSDQLKKKDAELYAKNTELQRLKNQTDQSVRGVEALTILLHYLTTEYSAFSTPKLKSQIEDLCSQLSRLKVQLDDSTAANQKLQQEALHKEKDFNEQINSLQEQKALELNSLREQHTTEIANLKNEHERSASQLLEEEATKRALLEQRHGEDIKNSAEENNKILDSLKAQRKAALQELEEAHLKNLKDCESRWSLKEQHLLEKKEKLEKEKEFLVEKANKLEQTLLSDNDHRLQAAKGVCTALQKEVDSLKSVLEMKNSELHHLREQVADREVLCDNLDSARERIRTLKAKTEDLTAQMEKKAVYERQRNNEYRMMSESLQRESCANRRLAQEKEELLWKLRNRDGHSPNITSTPVADDGMRRLPRHDFSVIDIPHFSTTSRLNNTFPAVNGKRHDLDEDSPPGSPRVKGVIEKSNSVSFTLDLGESDLLQEKRERARSYSKSPETPRNRKTQNIRKQQLRLENLTQKGEKCNIMSTSTDNSFDSSCSTEIPRSDASSGIEVDRVSPTGVSWTVPVGPIHLRNLDVDEFEGSDSSLSLIECNSCDSDVSQCGSNVELSSESQCNSRVEVSDSSDGTEMWVQNPQDGAGEAMIPCDILPKDPEPTPEPEQEPDPLRPLSSITSILSSDSEDPKISWSDEFDLTSSSEIQDNVS